MSSTKKEFTKQDFYRYSRMLHGYLSAFAFLALMFFALTGLFLNHPTWFESNKPRFDDHTITLSANEIATALKTRPPKKPAETFAVLISQKLPVRGVFKDGELLAEDQEAHIRMEGVTGKTDIVINLKTGVSEVTVENATAISMIQDLHRGKNSGQAWQFLIDVTAILTLLLSLLGYILFFSIRFRLATSLALTGISLVIMFGFFWFFVP